MKDNATTQAEGSMSRNEMQTEAMTIASLLSAAMAVLSSKDTAEVFDLVDMAQGRAQKLNLALDSLHETEDAA